MPDTPSIASVKEKAAYWAVRMECGAVTDQDSERFETWVLADRAHESALLDQIAIGALATEMTLRARTSRLQVVEESTFGCAASSPVWAIAVTLLLAATTAVWFAWPWSPFGKSYITGAGEQRTVQLGEGSSATLNTRSEFLWTQSAQDRLAVLKRGEVLFDVAPDRYRPVRVRVDEVEMHVLGTQFNAYRRHDGSLIVSVLKGALEIVHRDSEGSKRWLRRLAAGQQLRYGPGGSPLVRNSGVNRAVRWKHGELEIEDAPLSDVVAELARYTDRRIVLTSDPRLTRLRVGGVLSIYNIDSALRLLEQREPIKVMWSPEEGEYTLSIDEGPMAQSSTAAR